LGQVIAPGYPIIKNKNHKKTSVNALADQDLGGPQEKKKIMKTCSPHALFKSGKPWGGRGQTSEKQRNRKFLVIFRGKVAIYGVKTQLCFHWALWGFSSKCAITPVSAFHETFTLNV